MMVLLRRTWEFLEMILMLLIICGVFFSAAFLLFVALPFGVAAFAGWLAGVGG